MILTSVRDCDDTPPRKIVILRGNPHFDGCETRLNPFYDFYRLTKPKASKLEALREEWSKAKDAEEAEAENRKRAAKAQHQRYVVWNHVYDFDGALNRDGFLVEIFDGRGRLLLRNVWTEMLDGDGAAGINSLYTGPDFEEMAVKFMAHMSCGGERVKPVVVHCDKID